MRKRFSSNWHWYKKKKGKQLLLFLERKELGGYINAITCQHVSARARKRRKKYIYINIYKAWPRGLSRSIYLSGSSLTCTRTHSLKICEQAITKKKKKPLSSLLFLNNLHFYEDVLGSSWLYWDCRRCYTL